jgi:hypothetical protein
MAEHSAAVLLDQGLNVITIDHTILIHVADVRPVLALCAGIIR